MGTAAERKNMDLKFVLVMLVGLLLIPAAHAVTEGIELSNCGFTSAGPFTCAQSVTATCRVLDTFSGVSTVNSVEFVINGRRVQGSLTSGTVLNGTWSASVTITDANSFDGMLTAVTARDSSGNVCSGSENREADGCKANFTSVLTYSASCGCTYSTVTVCGTNNVATITKTPTAGCTDQTVISSTGTCDYCNPQWQISDASCQVGATASQVNDGYYNKSTAQTIYNDPWQGYASVSLVSGNPSCCATTGLVSDCTPPLASSLLVCREDTWIGAHNDVTGDKFGGSSQSVTNLTTTYDSRSETADTAYGRVLHPVVIDADNDGKVEIIQLQSGGVIGVYSPDLDAEEATISTGATYFTGELATYTYAVEPSGSKVFATGYQSGTSGVGIAAVAYYSGIVERRLLKYQYNMSGASWDLVANVSLDYLGVGGNVASGVVCTTTACWTMLTDGVLGRVDNTLNTLTSTVLPSGSTSTVDVNWKNTPIVVSTIPEVVVTKGLDTNGLVRVYACSSGTCTSVNTGINSTEGVQRVSELSAGAPENDGTYGNSVPVFWTEILLDASTNLSFTVLKKAYVATSTLTWHHASVSSVESGSSNPTCISNPAAARCSSGSGVAISTGYETTTGLTINSFTDAAALRFPTTVNTVSPFTGVGAVGQTALQGADCNEGVCVAFSGRTSATNPLRLFYVLRNGGWLSIPGPGGLGTAFNTTCAINGGGSGTIHDDIVSYAMIDSNTFLLTRASCALTQAGTDVSTSWVEYGTQTLVKYTVSTNSWSSVGTIAGSRDVRRQTSFSGNVVAPHRMMCDLEDGSCVILSAVAQGVQPNQVLVLNKNTYAYSVFEPKGTFSGLNVSTQMMATGYYEDSSGNKYVTLISQVTTGTTGVAEYLGGVPTALISLEINPEMNGLTHTPSKYPVGLFGSGNDVYWTRVSNTIDQGGNPCVSVMNSTNVAWDGPGQIIYGESAAASYYRVCQHDLRRFSGVSVTSYYSRNVTTGSRGTNDFRPISGGTVYRAGIDENGEYYSILPYRFFTTGTPSYVEMMFTRGFFGVPHLVSEVSGVDGSACTVPSSDLAGTGCFPYRVILKDTSYPGEHLGIPVAIGEQFSLSMRNPSGTDWRIDYSGSTSAGVSDFTEFTCYSNSLSGGLQKISTGTVSNTYCPTYITTTDYDGDNVDEVVTYNGVFKTSGAVQVKSFTGNTNASVVIPVDFTSDTYTDFVFITPSAIKSLVSRPSISVSLADSLSVQSATCTYDDSTHLITAVANGVGAQNPTQLQFSGDLLKDGSVVKTAGSTTENRVSFSVAQSGNYTVNMLVSDPVSSESATASCSVYVSSTSIPDATVSSGSSISTCTINGEFNVDSWVQAASQGWLSDDTRRPSFNGTHAKFSTTGTSVYHGIGCLDQALEVTFKASTASGSVLTMMIEGEMDGTSVPVVAVRLNREVGKVILITGDEANSLSSLVSNEEHEYTVGINVSTNLVSLQIDGEIVGEGTMMNEMNGRFTRLKIVTSGVSAVDYVRTKGVSGIARSGLTTYQFLQQQAFGFLDTCTVERDFDVDPAGNGTTYSSITPYCGRVNRVQVNGVWQSSNDGLCTLQQLQDAVRYNRDCFKEAFNYCVKVTYPTSAGLQEGTQVANKQSGLDGAAACNTILMGSVGYSSIIGPWWRVIWTAIKANWILSIVLGLLLFVYVAAKARSKGGGGG